MLSFSRTNRISRRCDGVSAGTRFLWLVALVSLLLVVLISILPKEPGPVTDQAIDRLTARRARLHGWKYIVVHHSATSGGGAAAFDRYHRRQGWGGLAYHFVIGNGSGTRNGEIEVGRRWRRQSPGAHCASGRMNREGIGICLVGDFESSGPPSAAQMKSLLRLIGYLQGLCRIPVGRVIGHREVPGAQTACPGKYFPLRTLRATLRRPSNSLSGGR